MVQILEANPRRSTIQNIAAGLGPALQEGVRLYGEHQKKKDLSQALENVNSIYADPNMTQEQKFIKSFSLLRNHPEVAKSFTTGMSHFSETPLQKAQRLRYEQETKQLQGEEDYLNRLSGGEQAEASGEMPYDTAPEMETEPGEPTIPKGQPSKPKPKPVFDLQNPSTWTDEQVQKFRAYKGTSVKAKSLATAAENESARRGKVEKTAKEQKAVKNLLKETGKFATEEELNEAARTYDLPTATKMWQDAKKPKPKTESQKLLDKEMAKGYVAAVNELPKLQSTVENIGRLKELGGKLRGVGGYVKSAFNTASASEYNTLSASLLDPIIKVFNPVGAVPVTKLNWIRDTFAPKASDLASTQEGKLATLERLAQQAKQRAEQKIKLFNDYNGEPPESAVLKFDAESAKMINDFVDNQQYTDQLKKELPEGKILMLDAKGKPLHVDPYMVLPNGMRAIEYAIEHGARIIE